MLRTRILSAATAALLMLGASVGGTGVAFAADEPRPSPDGELTADPAPFSDDGTKNSVPEALLETPANETAGETCVVVIWQMPSWVSQWTPTWPQSFVSVHDSDCAATQIDAQLFPVPEACGTHYQLDKYYVSDKTTALIAGGVLLGYGPEEDLVPGTWGTLVHNLDCAAAPVDVAAAFSQLTCDLDPGSFTVGLADLRDPNADKLVWTTTAGTVPSETANTVAEPGVVTVTVRVATAHLGDVAVTETSSLGVVSTISVDGVETALITWTFAFVAPVDCELGAVAVPIVVEADHCVGVGPNAVRVATFTVTDGENIRYQYTVNGGSPIEIVFADGEIDVTVVVSPLDVVEVAATAAPGFELPQSYTPWSHTFLESAFCPETFPATVAAAEITPADCDARPVMVTLTNEDGVIWTLNGEVVAGNTTHELSGGSAVQVTASLEGPTEENQGGWTWSDPEQQTAWTEEGVSEDSCLASLAYTGAASTTGLLGAAAVLMMLVGVSAVVRRRTVEV